jgi:zinc transporter 7
VQVCSVLTQVFLTFAAGILLFFLVEKVVRYVEERSSQGVHGFHHGHHHHHKSNVSSKKDEDQHGPSSTFIGQRESSDFDKVHGSKALDANADADADANGSAAEREESLQELMLRKVR